MKRSSSSSISIATLGLLVMVSSIFAIPLDLSDQVKVEIAKLVLNTNQQKNTTSLAKAELFPPIDISLDLIFSPGYPVNGQVVQVGDEFYFTGHEERNQMEVLVLVFPVSEFNEGFELPNLTTSDGLTKKMDEKFILVEPNGSQIQEGLPHYIFLLNGEMVDGILRIKIYGLWMFYFGYRAPLPEVIDGSCWPTSIADTLYTGIDQIPKIQVWASNPEGETLMIWCYVFSSDGTLLWWLQEPLSKTPQYFYPDANLTAGEALLVLKISNGKRGVIKRFPFVVAKKPVNLLVASVMKNGDDKFSDLFIKNRPNPFNPETTISFNLSEPSNISLDIYNTLGQIVKVLADAKFNAGQHDVVWNGTDENGNTVPSGIYLCVIKVGNLVSTHRMTFLK